MDFQPLSTGCRYNVSIPTPRLETYYIFIGKPKTVQENKRGFKKIDVQFFRMMI